MSDVFDEISDDLRREKLNQFWKENGSWIIGGVIGAVVLTSAIAFWRHWQYQRDVAATKELVHLVTVAESQKLESFAKETGKKHAAIAKFTAAAAALDRGDKEHAAILYSEIAGTFGLNKTYRELAQLLSIAQRLDTDDAEKLKKELADLSGDAAAWRYTARELEALLNARQGHTAEAVEALTKITADPSAPTESRARAFTLRELYVAEEP